MMIIAGQEAEQLLELLERIDNGYQPDAGEKAYLEGIETLDISDNSLRELPECLGQLTKLHSLYVRGNQLTELPECLGQLTKLQSLDVSSNQLTELPEWLSQLTNLQSLYVGWTQLRELPECLGQLTKLQSLYVSGNQLTELPEWIGKLTKLQSLNVSVNQLMELPEWIEGFTNLERLDISYTQIQNLPNGLWKLTGMKKLALRGLHLVKIPEDVLNLNLSFDIEEWDYDNKIFLKDTNIATQPLSLFAQPRELIEAYYKSEKVSVSEAKVIFLGYGDAGKTYTIKRILNGGKKDEYETKATPGIDIKPYSTTYCDQKLNIHFWDFGGQEVMHAMHRCFLTGRTCYVVVVDNRKENMTEQAEYWLRTIDSFAKGCPVILAVNRIEGCRDSGINMNRLKDTFSNLVGNPIYYSAKTSSEAEFQCLTDAICRQASMLDSWGMEFPAAWDGIRRELLTRSDSENRYYLTKEEYHQICQEQGEENADIRKWLLEWFNDLGVCFSYHLDQQRKELQDYQILNPRWLTNALYIIINTCGDFSHQGVVSHKAIDNQLNNASISSEKRVFQEFVEYKPEECIYILQIMRKFQLSYEIPNESAEFIPALCVNETPLELHPTEYTEHLTYEMRYAYLPDTVIHRLMILCYQDLNMSKIWRQGLRIDERLSGISAVTEIFRGTTLRIDVYTQSETEKPWKVLAYLRAWILQINQDLGLSAEDFVIVHQEDKNAEISVEFLFNLKKEGIDKQPVPCIGDNKVMMLSVSDILGETFGDIVSRTGERENLASENMYQIMLEETRKSTEIIAESTEGLKTYMKSIEGRMQKIEKNTFISAQNTGSIQKAISETAQSTREIQEHTARTADSAEKLIVQVETVIENQEELLEQAKLVNDLIAALSTHSDERVRQFAKELQEDIDNQKNPWEKVKDFLGHMSNVVTILSSIAPLISELLQIPELQTLPLGIMVTLKCAGFAVKRIRKNE